MISTFIDDLILIIHISNQLATFGIGAENIVLMELMSAFATVIDLFIGGGNVIEV